MSDVLTEDRFAIEDQQSVKVALAMLHRRLIDLDLSELLISRLLTVSSELAVNVIKYARRGTLSLKQLKKAQKRGLQISVVDEGPGIADVEQALEDHFSSKGTLGLGLPGVKRMVDDFHLESEVGQGTRVYATVWL
jgi:serine/threonine-protein kinase RsbT